MYWIERRAGRELFSYMMMSENRYEDLGSYKAKTTGYINTVTELLPAEWKLDYSKGMWCKVNAPNYDLPNTGFKIHISTEYDNAELTLNRVTPVLVKLGVSFKFLVDKFSLQFANSQVCSKSASGKFITIYPKDRSEFYLIVEELKRVTSDLSGPYILSDQRVEGSKVIFYRYGAFMTRFKVNLFGEYDPLMEMDSGEWSNDIRGNYFQLPDEVKDPFNQSLEIPSEIILNNRYLVQSSLADSNKGGVYLALDQLTNEQVVIKEVRPYINYSEKNPFDAIALLKNEEQALTRLASTGVTPQIIETFTDWEHCFIAMKKIAGDPLTNYRAREDFSIILKTDATKEDVKDFFSEVIDIAEKILAAVYLIHDENIVITDLAPQNILYDEDAKKINIIDLESALILDGDGPKPAIGTIGYGDIEDIKAGTVDFSHDFKALGDVIYNLLYPVNESFALNKEAKYKVLTRYLDHVGAPKQILDLVTGLSRDRENNSKLIEMARKSLGQIIEFGQASSGINSDQVVADIEHLSNGLLKNTEVKGSGFKYRPDYRAFSSSDLSFIYGVTGIVWTLNRIGKSIDDSLLINFILEARKSSPKMAPSLAVGTTGLAWTLWDLGYKNQAEILLSDSGNSKLLEQSADLFYGAAGWGLANLYFYSQSSNKKYIHSALKAESMVSHHLKSESSTQFFTQDDGSVFSGLAHGASGIALFYLRLYQATDDTTWLQKGKSLLEHDINLSIDHGGYLTWKRAKDVDVTSPYLRVGSAGVVQVLLRYYEATENPRYLELAKKGVYYLINKMSVSTGLLNGMAGLGECLLDCYRFTNEEIYLQEAHKYAQHIRCFGLRVDDTLSYSGEDNMRLADDFGSGSSGVLWFLHRLQQKEGGFIYDF